MTGRIPPTLSPTSLAQLKSATYRSTSPLQKLTLLHNLPNRYRAIAGRLVTSKLGVGLNGLTYMIGKSQPVLPASTEGAARTTSQQSNLVVCEAAPVKLAKMFSGPLFIGSGPSLNQSVIYPGALFKDADIVRGQFTPQLLPRKPGTILIDVYNEGGGVSEPVANFNDRTAVVTAINNLRTETSSAEALAMLDFAEITAAASQQLSLEVEASMDVDIGPSLNLPIPTPFNVPGSQAGASLDAAITTTNRQNFAIGVIDQVFYTISMGGEGPASTVDGTIPADVVAVTDVQYGRVAYIIVSSVVSRAEAQAVVQELVRVSSPLTQQSQQGELSVATQFALQSDFVRVKIMGGNVATAVTVRDLATLRNFIEQIDPTVGGANAVPIRYTLRYAADNATAFVGAVANFNDRECARASQVRVKLKSITPTKVVDFGDEELYGSVTIPSSAGVTPASDDGELWKVASTAPVQGREGVAIGINKEILVNLNPLNGPSPSSLKLDFNVRDRIMVEEYPGTTDAGRSSGFVRYKPADGTMSLTEVRDAPAAKKSKSFTLTEDGQVAKVTLAFEFELLPVR